MSITSGGTALKSFSIGGSFSGSAASAVLKREAGTLSKVLFQPKRLPRESKFFVTEILPLSPDCEFAHFVERKCALGGKTRVETSHRFAKNQRGQEINAGPEEKSAPQIRHQNKFLRQFAAPPQNSYRILIAEVMKRQRTKRDVVGLSIV